MAHYIHDGYTDADTRRLNLDKRSLIGFTHHRARGVVCSGLTKDDFRFLNGSWQATLVALRAMVI